MPNIDIGNKLYGRISAARTGLFLQGEMAQLTYLAMEHAIKFIRDSDQEQQEISYPVGYRPDNQAIQTTRTYGKQELIDKYAFLANHQLSINGIYQLVAIMEALLGDIIRFVILKFPHKLGPKRSIKSSVVLSASSIEEIHIQAVDAMLNDLSYKSPREFAEECENILSIKLLECPSYHKYIEVKATRDIYIHNRGIANDIYVSKADSHARVQSGDVLPINTVYFLESYESCLKITEWLESNLHDIWHSSEYETYKAARLEQAHQENQEPDQSAADEPAEPDNPAGS